MLGKKVFLFLFDWFRGDFNRNEIRMLLFTAVCWFFLSVSILCHLSVQRKCCSFSTIKADIIKPLRELLHWFMQQKWWKHAQQPSYTDLIGGMHQCSHNWQLKLDLGLEIVHTQHEKWCWCFPFGFPDCDFTCEVSCTLYTLKTEDEHMHECAMCMLNAHITANLICLLNMRNMVLFYSVVRIPFRFSNIQEAWASASAFNAVDFSHLFGLISCVCNN